MYTKRKNVYNNKLKIILMSKVLSCERFSLQFKDKGEHSAKNLNDNTQ